MIRLLFILCLLVSIESTAQTARHSDSLFLVKNYLLNIKHAANEKVSGKVRQENLDRLMQEASIQKTRFEQSLVPLIKDKQVIEELTTSFNCIIQSLILYKTDLPNKAESVSEIEYLNRNIPILVDRIYYYCKVAHQRSEK